ncbi:MAG: c-type cytochrome [Verrucomicrobiota bacterium]|jgi:YVTN family beta-propeller protein|nr:c-type cytochrome [Verrucomicrobiota bacterium]
MMRMLIVMVVGGAVCAGAAGYVSPEYVAVSPDGKTLYVTAATAGRVLRYDAADGKPAGEWPLQNRAARRAPGFFASVFGGGGGGDASGDPSGLAVAADGAVFVTGGGADGFLQKLAADGAPVAQVAAGHTPMAPVLSADGAKVYVLNRFENRVRVFDAQTLKETRTIPVLREPHAAVLGAGGRLLFVANHLPAGRATDSVVAAAVSIIDTATDAGVRDLPLPNGSTGVRGIGASPDGKFVYVTHTFGRYQLPTTQLERGWMNTAGLSVFNGETGDYVNTVLLDDVDKGAANPWGVAVSPDGRHLVVAHAGTRELSVIDRAAFHERLDKAARNEKVTEVTKSAADVPNDLSFLVTIRRRVVLDGDGPRGVAVAGGTVYAALYFADALASVNLGDPAAKPALAPLGAPVDLAKDRARRGEMLWNDGTMCFQQWQSCASCHPDGRADALNWDLMNDGIGNPKQTKSLVYTYLTPPTMVTGIRPDVQACNRKGLTHIQFVVRPEEDALCLDAYTMALKPVPSPYLVNGALSAKAKKGEKLFRQAGCAECHPADRRGAGGERLFTNLRKYNLGLGVGNEEGREFDTPTLVEIWRTAPYLYDGRSQTMDDVLKVDNPKDTHGVTQALTAEDLGALAEYILSL